MQHIEHDEDNDGIWFSGEAFNEQISSCESTVEDGDNGAGEFQEVKRKRRGLNATQRPGDVCVVTETRGKWMTIGGGVDSCAADHVAPTGMFPDVPIIETEASKNGKTYAAANGGEIKNEGEKVIPFTTNEGFQKKARFQVAKVTKVLLSASKITKAGYEVNLATQNPSIKHKKSGETIYLKEKNGIFVIDMWINTELLGRVFNRQGP